MTYTLVEKLQQLADAKLGDYPMPAFLREHTDNWGVALSEMAREALAKLEACESMKEDSIERNLRQ